MQTYVVTPLTARPGPALAGNVLVPGDKSIGHRALMFAALCEAPVTVTGLGQGADNGRTAKAMIQLGATIERVGEDMVVSPVGLARLTAPGTIDCGNSGTTMRLLAGLLGGLPFATTLIGDASLSNRPMARVATPVRALGGVVNGEVRNGDLFAPLVVGGPEAAPRAAQLDLTVASAQVKSAAVLAALFAEGVTTIVEHAPTRDHTERMLAAMGAPIAVRDGVITVDTRGWSRALTQARIDVPRDPSASAFFVVAALIARAADVTCADICVNPTRIGFLDAIAAMGGQVERHGLRHVSGEPVADLRVGHGESASLHGATLRGELVVRAIDEIPVLAVLAARAAGTTVIADAEELRVKESDRIATTCAMLRAFGVHVEERPDGMVITGQPDTPLRAAQIHAHGDHRIAMAAAIGALVADGPTTIDDCDNVATSFPSFVAVLRQLGAALEVRHSDAVATAPSRAQDD
ncbi:MAG: 3-phosphoshikimate 1-carboxyvinyltransferase [Myxococcales bacterium]|nr:3-phosphoshikimate 1-carboxyvinyltransferase [Myxococcales bacterium]